MTTMTRHEVFFILDPYFTGDLWSLSREAHVWLIESAHNKALAQAVWERETKEHSPLIGVTTFEGSDDPSETFYRFLGTIDDHHNEYSAPRPWDTIYVIGFPLERASQDRIAEELGVDSVRLDSQSSGFAIHRAA